MGQREFRHGLARGLGILSGQPRLWYRKRPLRVDILLNSDVEVQKALWVESVGGPPRDRVTDDRAYSEEEEDEDDDAKEFHEIRLAGAVGSLVTGDNVLRIAQI